MKNKKESINLSSVIREQTIELLNEIQTLAETYKLPKPPPNLGESRQKLINNQYKVLVVGEAKRGKSTFINAIIGQNILPTDVDIATSQVFHLTNANEPSYKIRFEDESTQVITAADLDSYGSQVVIDEQDVTRLDQIIRWIEVEIPAQFLPEGMSILDTPGLGSLYSDHSQITQRFVPFADAVIYVLDSTQPMGQPDIEFIEKILEITDHIFFIQTRIDQFRRKDWRTIQKRNQELLRERFADRLANTNVWPVSSTNLLKAIETGDQDYLKVSRSQTLLDALQTFLLKVAGWSRTNEALRVAKHYHKTTARTLTAHLKSTEDPSQDNKLQLRKLAEERRWEFENNWGEAGLKRQSLILGIETAITEEKDSFDRALQPGGDIEQEQIRWINGLDSRKELAYYGRQLRGETLEKVIARWQRTVNATKDKVGNLFAPFLITVEFMNLPIEMSQPHTSSEFSIADEVSLEKFSNLMTVGTMGDVSQLPVEEIAIAGGRFVGKLLEDPDVQEAAFGGILELVGDFFADVGDEIFPYLGTAVKVIGATVTSAIIALGIRKWQKKEIKDDLQEHLAGILIDLRRYFFDIDPVVGASIVDQQFNYLLQTTSDHIRTVSEQKLIEAEADIKRLKEDVQLNAAERQVKVDELRSQLEHWFRLEATINRLNEDLKKLSRTKKVP